MFVKEAAGSQEDCRKKRVCVLRRERLHSRWMELGAISGMEMLKDGNDLSYVKYTSFELTKTWYVLSQL